MSEIVKQGELVGCPYRIEKVGDFFTGTVQALIVGCATESDVMARVERIVRHAHEDTDQW